MALPAPEIAARPPQPASDVPRASPLNALLPHVWRLLRREPGVAITLAYVLVAMAGIFYNQRYFDKFGIPVLSLSQISDFLVAGIQQPIALALLLSTLPLCWLVDFVNMRSRRKQAVERERLRATAVRSRYQRLRLRFLDWRLNQQWYSQLGFLTLILVYGSIFVAQFADYRADHVRRGEAPQVRVWLTGEHDSLLPAHGETWTYLGAVGSYVFVYDREAARSVILPVNNIARIEPADTRPAPAALPMLVPIP